MLPLPAAPARASERAPLHADTVESDDGARIHYVDNRRNGEALALLFVPGWGMDASIWQRQLAEFGRDHRVVAVDPRSQGRSQKTADGNTPEVRAGDLARLIASLELRQVVLIGWSQGVQDVAAYVERFGTDRLAALVLVDAPVSAGTGLQSGPAAEAAFFERLQIYAAHPRPYLEGMMRAIFARPLPAEAFARRVDVALQTPTSIGIAMLVIDLYGRDRRPALDKFDKPTLVVASASSPELAAQKAGAERAPAGARFEVIENAGHAVFVDQPEQFNRLLRGFLNDLRAGP